MKKIILVAILIILLLPSCKTRRFINGWEVTQAYKYCESKGGVNSMSSCGEWIVMCADGSRKKIRLPVKD